MPMPLLAFDLDGVLYSSEPFLGEAYREAIAHVNARHPGAFPRVPATREILAHVGWPIPVIFANLFPDAAPAALAALHGETVEVICRRVAAGEGIRYPHVPETLRRLHDAGHALCVASNGRARYVETVLATCGVAELFLPRITADDVGDKTAILRHYLAILPAAPRRTVMVGDRASDVEAARAVGCHFVGCDYGHGHRQEIAAAGPLVADFAALPAVIAGVLG
ncbi:HAD family hydrolase [bacterium]|nr:HAD family hydrolase [bacterium]